MVATQLGAVPEKTMFAVGMTVVFEDVADNDAVHERTLSISETAKFIISSTPSKVV